MLVNLQGTCLRNLWSAQEDDSVTDCYEVIVASDIGRNKSVNVLNELLSDGRSSSSA